jgi:sterol 24-C-methyltransferase
MFGGARKSTGAITSDESVEGRKQRYADMVNHFYNLVTDFYEWGWGQSFHFGPRFKDETFVESIKRAEYYLALRLGMKAGMKALDVGCGVGGPMRNIAMHTGSNIEGITINEYQVKIGNKYNENTGLAHLCLLKQGDFQNLPWPDKYFDVAYEIEATCHSPDRVQTFSGVNRVLKQGGLFAGYEWVVTPKYDPNNKDHVRIKEGIEVGNGLPTLVPASHILECMEKAGFEIIDSYDANRGVHAANEIPWYDTLNGKMSVSGFRMTHLGRLVTHSMVWTLELLRIAPEGSTKVSALLNATAIDLCDGGKLEIFTPSFFFIGKKVRDITSSK